MAPNDNCITRLTAAGKIVALGSTFVALFAFGLLVAVWAGDMSSLIVYFGFIFGLECLFMIVPAPTRPEDYDPDTYICRKSWRYHYNLMIQFTTVMFLLFVITCVVLMNGVKPVGRDDNKVIPVAITISLVLGVVVSLIQGVRRFTYMASFWILFSLLLALDIKMPNVWLNIFGGLAAIFLVTLAIETTIQCCTKSKDLHEHLAVGLALVFSAYSLFDDWRYWYTRPYRQYGPMFAMAVGAGILRALNRYFQQRLTGTKEIAYTNSDIDGDGDVSDDEEMELRRLVRQKPISELRGVVRPAS